MTSLLPDFSATRRVLSNRNFALYTAGNFVSLVGTWIQRLAQGWLVWQLTESGTWLGAVAVAEFLPTLIVTPITGALADRFDRRILAVIGQILACLQAVALCTITALGLATPELIFGLATIGGIVYPLVQTARLTLIPSLLDKKDYTSAIAITAVSFNVTRIAGPAIAGVVISTLGIAPAFGLNAVSYLAVIFALLALRIPKMDKQEKESTSIFADLIEGWRYMARHKALGPLLLLWGIACMFALPLQHLLPGIIDTYYGGGPEMLATFTATMGIAAVFTGVYMAQRSGPRGLTKMTLIATVFCGLATAGFAATHTELIAYIMIGVLGLFGVALGTTSQTLVQTAVDESYRGRALSVWYTVIGGGQALGALVLGALAELYGFGPPLIVAGMFTALAAVAMLPKRSRYANLLEQT
jgi:MFS family permease